MMDLNKIRSVNAVWHILGVCGQAEFDFADTLAEQIPVVAWAEKSIAKKTGRPLLESAGLHSQAQHAQIRTLPAFAGPGASAFRGLGLRLDSLIRQIASECDAEHSTLVCTESRFASIAEAWAGRVVYWPGLQSDSIPREHASRFAEVEQRMCAAATLVCPRSHRSALRLIQELGCAPDKVVMVPEGTRTDNLLGFPSNVPAMMPGSERNIPRPIAGVVGDLAETIDWDLLQSAVDATPWLSWVFVGRAHRRIADPTQEEARRLVMNAPTTYFVGEIEEANMSAYMRAFDVAVMAPCARAGLWTPGHLFFDHLAACRPLVLSGVSSTPEEDYQVRVVDGADTLVQALNELRLSGFDDGSSAAHWRVSRTATWQSRARSMQLALAERTERIRPDRVLPKANSRAAHS